MKFIFTKNLDYQLDAINSTVNLFDTGKNLIKTEENFNLQSSTQIISNNLEIDKARIWKNLQSIQKTNNISPTFNESDLTFDDQAFILDPSELNMDFSIEMETGTGKTYVYLRTILELNQKYNLKKFIILVPSVAIREGVLKTLQQTKEHFKDLYNTNFGYFAYDSNKLNKIREFAQSTDIQIMIMTVQSFAGNERLVMRQTPDRFHGERPIDLIAQTNPIVIMDEPQNMESDLSREAIKDLNPLFKLRYSATHKEIHNLVYRLTPVDAYRKGLVKKISVYGVKEDDAGAFLFKVKNIQTKKGENPKGKVLLEVKKADGLYSHEEMFITNGDDIYRKSKKNEKYNGLTVQDIDANHNRVELSNSEYYIVDESENNKEVIFRTQIKETIKCHFDKQREIGDRLKVLSLFFIDKVDNYIHDDSIIKKIFIEEFDKLKKNYEQFKDVDVNTVHTGYFASKKVKGIDEFVDTKGDSKADKEAYDLIMKNKEDLLSFTQPVSFIFSHSALREGWDNPNVFQICTLRETQSVMTKRQEIGRGLRLPVDVNGSRVYDEDVAILTVIANSSYEEYAGGLQQEFEDAGYVGERNTQNAREKKITVKTTKYIDSEDFKELWKRISKKTTFSIQVLTEELTKSSVIEINKLNIKSISVTIEKGEIYFDQEGNMDGIRERTATGYKIEREIAVPNIIDRISKETNLTRKTVFEILSQVENLDLVFINPEEYIRSVILIIKNQLHNHLVNAGLKYTKTGEVYNMELLFGEFETLPSKSISSERSVFDHVVFDSKGEKEFAESLERSSKIRVYAKLPRGFYVDTPIGKYNPDWAIVWKSENSPDRFYLVRETKFGYNDLAIDLSWEERGKIKCARKHFEEIDVDYEVIQDTKLLDLIK